MATLNDTSLGSDNSSGTTLLVVAYAQQTAAGSGGWVNGAGLGYVIDNSRRFGIYGRLGVLTRY